MRGDECGGSLEWVAKEFQFKLLFIPVPLPRFTIFLETNMFSLEVN